MESIQLWRREALVDARRVGEFAIDVGRSPACDLVVAEPGVSDRAFVVRAEGGTVVAYDLSGDPRRRRPVILGRGRPFPVGDEHRLVRVEQDVPTEEATARFRRPPLSSRTFRLRIGGFASERVVSIGPGPVTVGRGSGNSVRLVDDCVSERHLAIEPAGAFVRVVDVGSRNGTFVRGERIEALEIGRTTSIRIGRTDLVVEPGPEPGSGFVYASSSMREVVATIDRFADLPFPVLLLGETGVGKEELASRLHEGSSRARGPLVAVDVSTIPPDLVATELFGHERGAFTGALSERRGAFEQAHGGTLFLDEVGELSLDAQARLLRVLETLEIRRLGAERTRRVDVRVVAATHRPLAAMVASGAFRRDLYFRLAQLPVVVPPLRDRRDDILPIARSVLESATSSLGPRELTREAEALLLALDYDGNVRELRNLLVGAAARSAVPAIDAVDLRRAGAVAGADSRASDASIATLLREHRGNVASMARVLGLPRTTVRDRIARLRAKESLSGR